MNDCDAVLEGKRVQSRENKNKVQAEDVTQSNEIPDDCGGSRGATIAGCSVVRQATEGGETFSRGSVEMPYSTKGRDNDNQSDHFSTLRVA